ncbi:MAG: tetratricopeptide repeat protein [Deltaproteobacteria bacterium]|nr:MAG: tetratricopeptide repeat protein [Deltaproteobacteria bacterium]
MYGRTDREHFLLLLPFLLFLGGGCERTDVAKGEAAFRKGEYERAAKHFEAAMQRGQETPQSRLGSFQAHFRQGLRLERQRRFAEAIAHYEKALALRSDDLELRERYREAKRRLFSAFMAEGALLATEGRWPEAAAAYRAALETRPDDPACRLKYARALQHSGREGEAIEEVRWVLRKVPQHRTAHRMMAEMLDRRGDRAGALEHRIADRIAGGKTLEAAAFLERRLAAHPEEKPPEGAFLRLAALYAQAHRWQKAWEAFEKAEPPTSLEAYLLGAEIATHLGKWTLARAYLDRATRQFPEDPQVTVGIARLLRMRGVAKEAIPLLVRAIAEHPREGALYRELGAAHLRLEAWSQAIEALERAIRLDPDDAEAHACLGAVHAARNERAAAISAFEAAVAHAPEVPEYLTALAEALLASHRLSEALEYFERLTTLEIPEKGALFERMGHIALEHRDSRRALRYFERARKLGVRTFPLFDALSRLYLEAQRYEDAIDAAREALAIDPTSVELHYRLGTLYYERKAYGDSARAYRRAIEHAPPDIQPERLALLFNAAAWSFALAGENLEEAIRLSERSLELRPEVPAFLDTLAELHDRIGDHETAVSLARRALERTKRDRAYYQRQLEKFESHLRAP